MTTTTNLPETILEECLLMIKYALESGKTVAPHVVQIVTTFTQKEDLTAVNIQPLALAHNKLSLIVAPATPTSLRYLQKVTGKGIQGILRSIPFIRNLLILAAICLTIFIVTSLTDEVRTETITKSYLELFGMELLLVEIFFLSAAGLGAAFAVLFEANHYIVRGAFDPRYIPSYAIRFALGIIAGIILAELINIDLDPTTGKAFAKPTLAMLGGFSASAVYKVLQRLLTAVETLVRGNGEEIVTAQQQLAQHEMQQQLHTERLQTATKLLTLQSQIASGTTFDMVKSQLNGLLVEFLPEAAVNHYEENKAKTTAGAT